MDERSIAERLERIEARLGQIENRIGIRPALKVAEPGIAAAFVGAPLEHVHSPSNFDEQLSVAETRPHATPPPLPSAALVRVVESRGAKPEVPKPRHGLEQTIGLKWAGWVGAIVCVISLGWFIKFLYEAGWFAAVPAWVKLTTMFAGGIGLIGAGEWVYRRINTLSATGFFGAGIAVLFLVSYSGHAYYGLYERNIAFVLMACSTLIGAAVARRGDLVSVAVLAVLGGLLAPALLQGGSVSTVGFLFYLLMLQVVSLLLAWSGGSPKWWTLRGLSLTGISVWLAVLMGQPGSDVFHLMLYFSLAFAVLFQLELLLSTARMPDRGTGPGPVFSLVVTAWLTAIVLHHVRDSETMVKTFWLLGLASAALAISFALRRRGNGTRPEARLATSFLIQAAALVALTVPVSLSGIWIAVGWGVLAIAFAVLGRSLEVPAAGYAAAAVWALAVADLVYWNSFRPSVSSRETALLNILGVPIYSSALMAWLLALIGHLISVVWRRIGVPAVLAPLVAVTATTLWVTATFQTLPSSSITVWFLVYAWVLAAFDAACEQPELPLLTTLVTLLAGLKWAFADVLGELLPTGMGSTAAPSSGTPVLGVAVAASLVGLYFFRRHRFRTIPFLQTSVADAGPDLWFVAVLILLWAGTLTIHHLVIGWLPTGWSALSRLQCENLFWTVWWTTGVSILFLTFRALAGRLRSEVLLAQRWWLIVLLAVKYLVIDTLFFRVTRGVTAGPVVLNLRAAAGAVLFGGLMILIAGLLDRARRAVAVGFAVLVLLWAGSFEIDQGFANLSATGSLAKPALAEQVALSVFWSVFALSTVAVGFRWRHAGVRYFGLTVFAITLLKVVTIDLSQLGGGYRILSFLGLGVLMMGTSVLYGKLAPRLLPQRTEGPSLQETAEP